MQHFVEVEGRDAAIAWATPDAPLACFQDINRGKWQTQLAHDQRPSLLPTLMNNYWHTNYLAGQGGDYVFRFAITSRAQVRQRGLGPLRLERPRIRCSASSCRPIRRAGCPASRPSLLSVAEPNVMVIGVKRADDGGGLIVRLWEIDRPGDDGPPAARPRASPPPKATACNLVEDPSDPLEIHDGQLTVPVRGVGTGHGADRVRRPHVSPLPWRERGWG